MREYNHITRKVWTTLLTVLLLVTLTICRTTSHAGDSNSSLRKIPREHRIALMIINFKNSTQKDRADRFSPWEFGLASMIMTDLESIGVFNILSRELLNEILREQTFQMTDLVDDRTAVKVGRIVAAKYVVTGTFMEIDGSLRIESRVLSVENGIQLGAASVVGKTSSFFDLEKQLVVEMTGYLGLNLDDNEVESLAQRVETKSIEASLHNYAGEKDLFEANELKISGNKKQADFIVQKARLKFEKALKYDPDYQRAKNNLASLTMAIPMTL